MSVNQLGHKATPAPPTCIIKFTTHKQEETNEYSKDFKITNIEIFIIVERKCFCLDFCLLIIVFILDLFDVVIVKK